MCGSMGNYLHSEVYRLEKLYLDDKLKRAYDRVREETARDRTMLKLSEQINLSRLYSDLLIDMEQTVKEAFGNDGIRWAADAWNDVSVKLKRPEFVYGSIMVDTIQVSKTAGDKIDVVRSKGAFWKSKMFLLLISVVAGLSLMLISDNGGMKVFGAVLSFVGVIVMLFLLQKQKVISSNQVIDSKLGGSSSCTSDIVPDFQLEKMQAKNREILKEWFKDALKYATDAEQNELIKERQE